LKDEEYTEITSVVDFLSADLKVGDKILTVNDIDTKGMTTDEILELLKGEGLRLTLREKAIRTEKGTLKQVFLRSLVFAY
jgi:C-terminal processing protease CtpA/Prc